MSIIQTIRDKGAKVAVVLIALALLGFIAMDAFSGRSSLFGGSQSTTVGKVNGKTVDIQDFRVMVEQNEANLVRQGYPSGETTRQKAIDDAWNQEVTRTLLENEVDKLGIRVTPKELSNSILFGSNPPQDLVQNFTDPNTGRFDAQQAAMQIREQQKKGTAEQKASLNSYLEQLMMVRKMEKYNSLLYNSIHYPKWMIEKQNADKNQIARISYVLKPYSAILHSAVKVTDQEINEYLSKHKDDYKQEESRSISYVTFSATPSGADTVATMNQLNTLKSTFETTPVEELDRYLESEGAQGYYKGFINGKDVQIANKDTIFRTPVGTVFGPYQDGGSFSLARMIATRSIPDSAKVRHILIATAQPDQQTGQMTPVRDSATARNLIDSIVGLIASGQPFDSVAAKLSEDPGSKDKGGVYEIATGRMVPEFNDFAFTNPVGTKGVVKTDFGYHYMEVMSQKGSGTGYKIAYISKPVLSSSATINEARDQATKFASASTDEKSFNENFEKTLKPQGLNKGVAFDIRPISFDVQGLGSSREFVRKINDADKGDVIGPDRVGESFVVAVVTEVLEEGVQPASKARFAVEPLLRNKKKAELIKKELGAISTLEGASSKLNIPLQVADSVRITGSPLIYDTKVIGATFNPNNRGKVVTEAIEGSAGVYVLRVDNVSATAAIEANVAQQQKEMYEQSKQRAQQSYQPFEAIRKAASIKDYRYKHY